MRWHNRYELLDPIAGAPGSFHGRMKGFDDPVLLHQLPGSDRTLPYGLLGQITALPAGISEHVRDIWEFGGLLYVVTDAQFGEVSLAEWLERAHLAPSAVSAAPSEFTQFFHAPEPLREAVALPTVPAPAPLAGEFTRFVSAALRRSSASGLVNEPVKPAEQAGVGELTRLFQARPEAEIRSPDQPPAPPLVPPLQEPQRRPVSDFTRLLGPMVAEPPLPRKEAVSLPELPMAAAPASLPPSGLGDYTRVVSAPRPAPATPPMAKGHPDTSVPAKRPGAVTPIIVFSALALLALALILVFAVWR